MKELILRSQFVGDFLFWSCATCLKMDAQEKRQHGKLVKSKEDLLFAIPSHILLASFHQVALHILISGRANGRLRHVP